MKTSGGQAGNGAVVGDGEVGTSVPAGIRDSTPAGGPEDAGTDGPQVAGASPAGSFGSRERGESSGGVGLKVGIVGCRPPADKELLVENIDLFRAICNDAYAFASNLPAGSVIVSGGAKGVDHAAALAAKRYGYELVEHLPDYEKHGPVRAPLARNLLIVAEADEVHAWPAPWSRGTWHSVNAAKRAGKPVTVHRVALQRQSSERVGSDE